MSKKLKVLLAVLIVVISVFAILAMSATAEEKEITISYMKDYEPTSATTTLDKVAHANGKVTVKAGEEITLPTTADLSYVGEEGYRLIWYTEDGVVYNAGQKASFTEDTKLFRAVSKEVYNLEDLNFAMTNNSHSATLMADIVDVGSISVWDQNYAVLNLNGYDITLSKNGTIMGGHRSAKIIVGRGTLKCINPDNKVGSHAVFECKSHSHNGDKNKTLIGRDVVIDAPNFYLASDGDGAVLSGYPWIKVYGTINVYYILGRWNTNQANPKIEFFDGCNVTLKAPYLNVDYKVPTDTTIYNSQGFDIRIYGGTFNLPAEAATEAYWTFDNIANQGDITNANKDHIKIEGGTFVLPDNAVPAISSYLTYDFVTVMSNLYDLARNNRSIDREVTYQGVRNAYVLGFKNNGTIVITDNMGTGLGGTYYYTATKNSDASGFEAFEIFDDAEKTIPTTKFKYALGGNNSMLFSAPQMQADYALQNLTANGVTYQVVVTAKCGENDSHSFNSEQDATVEANCVHTAYAEYVCSGCGYDVYFNWGDLADHTFSLTGDIKATETTLGEKTFTCSGCNASKAYPYTIDPSSLEITVVIRNDDDTFETKTVLASDIFDFAKAGVDGAYIYTVSAIKALEGYSVRNIYEISIPRGIMYIKLTTRNYEKYKNVEYGVEVLNFADNADIFVQNIGNLAKLKTINIGKANVKFASNCLYYNPNNERRSSPVTTINSTTVGANVELVGSAFKDRNISALNIVIGSKYIFGAYSLENTKITHFVIDDDLDITCGNGVFYNCNSLETVYVQKSIALTYQMFAQCDLLETVILAEGVTITGNDCFCGSGNNASVRLKVYAHNPSIYFPYQTFGDCEGMILYTNAPITAENYATYFHNDAFRNTNTYNYDSDGDGKVDAMYKYCVKDTTVTTPHNFDNNRNGKLDDGYYTGGEEVPFYTVYVGIPHEYAPGRVEPTCTVNGSDGYITDCPCGVIVDGIKYDKYENTTTTYKFSGATLVVEQGTYETTIIDALGHDLLLVTTSPTCLVDGDKTNVCQREGCGHEELVETLYARGNHVMIYDMSYPDGFAEAGIRVDKCDSCDEVTTESVAKAIFEALGYSVGPDGYSVKMGFLVSTNELEAYKTLYPTFEFGMLFINANSVATTESFFDGSALNATAKGIKVEVEGLKYVTINADLRGFNASNAGALELVMGVYTIDKDGKTSVIQYADATNYATNKTYADMTLNVVNFNQVRLAHGLEALVPAVTTGDDE